MLWGRGHKTAVMESPKMRWSLAFFWITCQNRRRKLLKFEGSPVKLFQFGSLIKRGVKNILFYGQAVYPTSSPPPLMVSFLWFFCVLLTFCYGYMCSETDFTQEQVNFHPTTEFVKKIQVLWKSSVVIYLVMVVTFQIVNFHFQLQLFKLI